MKLRYSCESGSRAWGLASTDSDYDVRFIYQHHREWYLQLNAGKVMIGPIMENDGELDLVGWDLRKLLSHLAGSNAGVIEWLYSPSIISWMMNSCSGCVSSPEPTSSPET